MFTSCRPATAIHPTHTYKHTCTYIQQAHDSDSSNTYIHTHTCTYIQQAHDSDASNTYIHPSNNRVLPLIDEPSIKPGSPVKAVSTDVSISRSLSLLYAHRYVYVCICVYTFVCMYLHIRMCVSSKSVSHV
jgi:hypothetical protein